ncbi:hypothetical protein HBH82_080950 [Parastagonospora nodorum]|nr:hypothetical protein HBH82_080950 [Parastagonospora nodorum]KAH4709491.1 hypothetical protein HBH67_044930 [Parastagonospora nodorum]KAH4802012.1 hypothetical protein HBH63_062240 [Parastagonospora nodorum]
MCAKDDLIRRKGPLSTSTQTWEVLFQTHDRQLVEELATAESVTTKDPNHVNTFSSDFAFSFAAYHRPFTDELVYAPSQFFSGNTDYPLVYVTIKNLSREARRRRSTPSTLLARFIPTTKIRDPLLKTLENTAKSRILLACADGRTRQCYPTICAILKHYNFNIHVSLATDTLHLLLKSLVIKMLDFMQDMLDDIYPSKQKAIIQQLIAIVSLLFISKAPFALHFIRAVCDLVTLAQYKSYNEDTLAYIQGALERMNIFKEEFQVYQRTLGEEKNFNYPKALDSICTGANSEAHHITIRTALLAADYATISIPGIQPHSTKLPLSEVAANIAISNFIHAAALHLILTIIDHTRYDKDRKHIAYIRAFSKVLLFNNNGQIDNTTRMLSFYDLSTIIRPVHLVPRDLPNSTTRTTMSYYVNNYID